jgi:hypothetical protein
VERSCGLTNRNRIRGCHGRTSGLPITKFSVLNFHNYGDVFQGESSSGAKRMMVEAGKEFVQIRAGEGQLKGAGGLFVMVLEGEQTLLESASEGKSLGVRTLR